MARYTVKIWAVGKPREITTILASTRLIVFLRTLRLIEPLIGPRHADRSRIFTWLSMLNIPEHAVEPDSEVKFTGKGYVIHVKRETGKFIDVK